MANLAPPLHELFLRRVPTAGFEDLAEWSERAAIRQYDGGATRMSAETGAAAELWPDDDEPQRAARLRALRDAEAERDRATQRRAVGAAVRGR